MKGILWNKIMTNNHRFSPGDPEYRRVYLLNFVLILLMGTFLLFSIANFFYLKSYVMAFIEAFGVFITLIIFYYFHKTDNINKGALATILFMLGTLILFLHLRKNHNYVLYWFSVVPPIIYFLLGSKKAHIVTSVLYVYMFFFIVLQYESWLPTKFNIQSISNIFGAILTLVLIVNYYEFSRKEAAEFLEEKNRELERLSITDKLTGLYNRTKLDNIIGSEIIRASRGGHGFSLILGDLDYFKKINDTYGHLAGDTALIHVAHILQNSCRELDAVGRWGGEEFLVVCPETEEENAMILAQRLLHNVLNADFKAVGKITISIGIATYEQGDTPDTILLRTDKALYKAKSNGRCRVEI